MALGWRWGGVGSVEKAKDKVRPIFTLINKNNYLNFLNFLLSDPNSLLFFVFFSPLGCTISDQITRWRFALPASPVFNVISGLFIKTNTFFRNCVPRSATFTQDTIHGNWMMMCFATYTVTAGQFIFILIYRMLVFLIGSDTIGTTALGSGGRSRIGGASHRRAHGYGRGDEFAVPSGGEGGPGRGGGLVDVGRPDGRMRGDGRTAGVRRRGLL